MRPRPERAAKGLWWDKENLQRLYVTERKTLAEIGSMYGVSAATVMRRLKDHSVPRRDHRSAMTKRGKRNGNWAGNGVSYSAFHKRIPKVRGQPQRCECCGISGPGVRYDWASLTKTHHDTSDYVRLCHGCHMRMDAARRRKEKTHVI